MIHNRSIYGHLTVTVTWVIIGSTLTEADGIFWREGKMRLREPLSSTCACSEVDPQVTSNSMISCSLFLHRKCMDCLTTLSLWRHYERIDWYSFPAEHKSRLNPHLLTCTLSIFLYAFFVVWLQVPCESNRGFYCIFQIISLEKLILCSHLKENLTGILYNINNNDD